MSPDVKAAEAVTGIVKLMQDVAPEDRERVIRAAASFLGVDLPPSRPAPFHTGNMTPGAR